MMATATVTNNEPPKENKGSSSSLDDISKVSSRRPSARRQRGGMSNSLSNSLNHRGSGLASTMGSLTTSFSEDIGKGLSKSDIGDILSAEFSDDDDNPKDKKNAEFPIKGSYNPKRKGKVRRSISFGDEQDKDIDKEKEKEGKGGVSFGDSSDNSRRRRRSSGRRGSNDPLRSSGTLRNSGGSAGSVDLLDSELNS